MDTPPTSDSTKALGFQRRTDLRVVAGLSAGLGDAMAIDTAYIRVGFILLTLAGGIGVVLYGLGWIITIDRASDKPMPPLLAASGSDNSRAIGFQLILVGSLVFASTMDLALHPSILWPAGLVGLGVANVWAHGDSESRQWLQGIVPGTDGPARGSRRETLTRLGIGGVFVAIGLTLVLTSTEALREAGSVVLAVSITLIGLVPRSRSLDLGTLAPTHRRAPRAHPVGTEDRDRRPPARFRSANARPDPIFIRPRAAGGARQDSGT